MTLETFFSSPLAVASIVSAIIAGGSAIFCKYLELRSKDSTSAQPPTRGFIGWSVIIASVAAVTFSIISLSLNRVTIVSDGTITGNETAKVELKIGEPSLVLITIQANAIGNQGTFRTAILPQLFVNGRLIASTMNRNTNGDAIEHQVSLTAYVPVDPGVTSIDVSVNGADTHSPKINGHYIILSR